MDAATLRERLRGIVRTPGTSNGGGAAVPGCEAVMDSVSDATQQSRDSAAEARDVPTTRASALAAKWARVASVLGGEWRESDGAQSFVISRRFDRSEFYGRDRVGEFGDAIERAAHSARWLGASDARAPFVFFDLETTGLSGGAGTHAFLVGCGWFDEVGGFVTEQHLMLDHGTESSMLRVVSGELQRAGALVSYNGKSFDAPFLETRYLYNRLESPCTERPHVDLLHPARRFWGGSSETGCSLVTLEAQVLGARRQGDVAGFEIPARYFHFLHTGEAGPLRGVLQHNRLDLLSLAGLTARAFSLLDLGPGDTENAQEALALGCYYSRAGLDERADQAFARAIALCDIATGGSRAVRARTKIDALRSLALSARRQGQHAAAAGYWSEVLRVPGCPDRVACEALQALAVHNEHRVRDLNEAKSLAQRGLAIETGTARSDATRHRLARIERKLTNERPELASSPPLPLVSGLPTSGPRTSS